MVAVLRSFLASWLVQGQDVKVVNRKTSFAEIVERGEVIFGQKFASAVYID